MRRGATVALLAAASLVAPRAAASLVAPRAARAHDVDVTSVARVFLDELAPAAIAPGARGGYVYALSVVDAKVPPIADPATVLPAGCTPLPPEAVEVRIAAGFAFTCEEPLGAEDRLRLPWPLEGVVVLARWADGSDGSAFFRGARGTIEVGLGQLRAAPGSRARLAGTYLALGAEHILLGVDHLLFVLGLLLLVPSFRALVKTITAFTVAHSITLAASVLGYVPLDRAPIEAAIALSIVLLAREIVASGQGEVHLTHRMPWLVAFVFGLLHGLGFAGALGDIGLPQAAVPLALLCFNLGVEVGQLAFVAVLLGLHALLRKGVRVPRARLEPLLGYALGALATFWFFERLPAIWTP
ncbi:MAG TPA: HupE/UreJ family protein [Longimicrobiales bacterium]|nr:HupE/UreJ family protein [Longimicrobiales bacterium]